MMGSVLGAALAFLIAGYLARARISTLAGKNAKFAAIDDAIGTEGWKIVLLLRLTPLIPFNASNYLYGLTALPFRLYLLASWIGMLPAAVLYAYLGVAGKAGLEAVAGQKVAHNPAQFVFWLLGHAATAIVTWYVSKIARKALQKTSISER